MSMSKHNSCALQIAQLASTSHLLLKKHENILYLNINNRQT